MSWVSLNSLAKRRSELADELFESYLRWREACEEVRAAYERWVDSTPQRSDLEFAIYRVALDREELAALVYSKRTARLGALGGA